MGRLLQALRPPDKTRRFVAGVVFASMLADWIIGEGFQLGALVVRVAWAAVILSATTLEELTGSRKFTESITACVSAMGFGLVALCLGGLASPMSIYLVAMPLAIAVLVGEVVIASVLGSATTLVMILMLWLDAPTLQSDAIALMLGALVSAAMAIFGAKVLRSSRNKERRALLSRAEAVEKLADVERERAEVERLAVVGRLAAEVAHEINNPLAFVKANVGVLREEVLDGRCLDDRELAQAFSETMVGIERIQQIVCDMKSLCRRDNEVVEQADPLLVIEEALRIARVRLHSSISVVRELPTKLPNASMDRRKMTQVLVNLLVNAAEALDPQKGHKEIVVRASVVEDQLRISVEDNGPGIPAELLPRMFEAFTTTKSEGKGLGLGLHLSREIVRRVGAELIAANLPERGACFSVVLPLRVSEPARGKEFSPKVILATPALLQAR